MFFLLLHCVLCAQQELKKEVKHETKKTFSRRKTRKITNIFIRRCEDLLKQIYYVKTSFFILLFCCFFAPQFHQFFFPCFLSFLLLTACKLFFVILFYVFSCYGIILCKVISMYKKNLCCFFFNASCLLYHRPC